MNPQSIRRGTTMACLAALALSSASLSVAAAGAAADVAEAVETEQAAAADRVNAQVQSAAPAARVITPEVIRGDIGNSLRGQYLWHPDNFPNPVPSGIQARDSYGRFNWNEIEPNRGSYNFAPIDRQLAAAAARRGTFAFRIMPVCGWCKPNALPSDLNALPTTWTASMTDGTPVRVPDWNDSRYLARWESLMKALGTRYDGDKRLGYIDVGGYGNWGEQHNWPYERTYPRPTGQRDGTVASVTRIARAVVRTFPRTFVAFNPAQMKAANRSHSAADSWAVLKAVLASSHKVGMRNDCLGGGSVQASAVSLIADAQRRAEAEKVPVVDQPLGRWRVAPNVSEWCDNIAPGSTDGRFSKGLPQVLAWHVSLVSNANFKGSLSSFPAGEQRAFLQAVQTSGFRIGVSGLTVNPVADGKSVGVTWINRGVAPTYTKWSVRYLLKTKAGTTVATRASKVPLSSLLGNGSRRTETIGFSAAELARGTELHTIVLDGRGYQEPMRLSSGARDKAGYHRLGGLG